jgi:hypothetical protein
MKVKTQSLVKLDSEIRKVYKITKDLLVKQKRKEAYEIIRYYKWHFVNRNFPKLNNQIEPYTLEQIKEQAKERRAWEALRYMEHRIRSNCSASEYKTPWRKNETKFFLCNN